MTRESSIEHIIATKYLNVPFDTIWEIMETLKTTKEEEFDNRTESFSFLFLTSQSTIKPRWC